MKPRGKLKIFSENMSANYGMAWDIVVGTVVSLLAALLYVSLFAAAIKIFHLSGKASIPVINQVAKVVCILLGAWMSVRRRPAKGWMRGGLTGMLYVVFSFVIFSLIDGDWTFGWAMLSDLLMGALVGGIGGIICVNLRKRK